MTAQQLAKYLYRLNGYMDMPRDILDITQPAADMLLQQQAEIDALRNQLWDLKSEPWGFGRKAQEQ
jgi:hypothetical protein